MIAVVYDLFKVCVLATYGVGTEGGATDAEKEDADTNVGFTLTTSRLLSMSERDKFKELVVLAADAGGLS